jgi:hypothetical protein
VDDGSESEKVSVRVDFWIAAKLGILRLFESDVEVEKKKKRASKKWERTSLSIGGPLLRLGILLWIGTIGNGIVLNRTNTQRNTKL